MIPPVSRLAFVERPADGEPAGLLVLHHGRGTDDHDLIGLADVLDPQRRIYRQFDGNKWKAEELAQALAEAARSRQL